MKRMLLSITALAMFGFCNFANAGDVNFLVKAIKTNDYTKVKKAFEDVRNKNESNAALVARIKNYYEQNWSKIGAGTPIAQAKIATGERGGPEWTESIRALKELGFGFFAE